jgi:chromate transporter
MGDAPPPPLSQLAAVFLRLGLTSFGGPAAHIAIMEAELVRRRKWLSHERFLDLLGASNLIPGPSSTELAIHIGWERGGPAGLLLAGTCFILPAALLVGALAWGYQRWGALPQVEGVLYGVKPVVIGVVVQALLALAPKAVKSRTLAAITAGACVAAALGVDALVVLVAAGALAVLARTARARSGGGGGAADAFVPAMLSALGAPSSVPVSLVALFLAFVKVGALVFGSGYVLLAFLRADLVDRLHWLTEKQLLDAVAVGQVTPGPVFTTATFIGYLVGGPWGAVVATLGIFLPGFVLVAVTRPLVARVRSSPVAGAFLDGVNAASLALMAVVTVQLARAAIVDAPSLAIGLVSAVLLMRWKVSSTWLVVGAASLGVLLARFR